MLGSALVSLMFSDFCAVDPNPVFPALCISCDTTTAQFQGLRRETVKLPEQMKQNFLSELGAQQTQ